MNLFTIFLCWHENFSPYLPTNFYLKNKIRMKKVTAALIVAATILWACNSTETKDSVETADSTNKANIDSANAGKSNQTITTDAETSSLLVHVADSGIAYRQ